MSSRYIHGKTVTARKPHPEMMSEWFQQDENELRGVGLTFSEWRAVLELKNNGWKILKGQKCEVFVGIDCDGRIYRGYYLNSIHKIVKKYQLDYDAC